MIIFNQYGLKSHLGRDEKKMKKWEKLKMIIFNQYGLKSHLGRDEKNEKMKKMKNDYFQPIRTEITFGKR